MEFSLQEAVKSRRTYYAIGKGAVLPDNELIAALQEAVLRAPSAFNSQSARVVLLLGEEHDRLWDITRDILKGIVPPANFASTEEKLASFRSGHGTLLFFEEQDTVKGLQEQFPLYRDNFPIWSLESSGMVQYGAWMRLESLGYGASLQHYNPLIDEKVREAWKFPQSWKLLGEMPFGKPLAQPDAKTFLPIGERFRVFP